MRNLIKHIQKLIKTGWSQYSIAAAVGTSQPTVNRILSGTKCSYDVGKKIEALEPIRKKSA